MAELSAPRQARWIVVLGFAAALSGYAVWQLRDADEPPPLVGPPRSDYFVDRFDLVAFDEEGHESFSVRGPRLARHPQLGTMEIEQPRIRMPGEGQGWRGRADRGWISSDAGQVRLLGAVDLTGPAAFGDTPLRVRSAALELLPKQNRVLSDDPVTVTGPGSILRGRGLRADLDARRFELLAEVTGRYETLRNR